MKRIVKKTCLLMLAAAVWTGNLTGCGKPAGGPAETAADTTAAAETVAETTPAETELADPFTAAADTVYVLENETELLSGYEGEAEPVALFYTGESLERTGYTEEWTRVLYEGKECYVDSRKVSLTAPEVKTEEEIAWDPTWKYAEFAKICDDTVKIYYAPPRIAKGKIVCVNAGHGTEGGYGVKTLCHPDGSPKVVTGSTAAGAIEAVAVSGGTVLDDGTPEPVATLKVAMAVKEQLLAAGYHVLMIREDDDVQLDNVARTVVANENADCHIAIHYDSSQNDKGAYYISVPDVKSYKNMEPVASHWESHNRLGEALIAGLRQNDVKIFSSGSMGIDLTQTSYSTVPSVDIEIGDRGSDHSDAMVAKLAKGLAEGIDLFFSGEAESEADQAASESSAAESKPNGAASEPNKAESKPSTAASEPNKAASVPNTAVSEPNKAASVPSTAASEPNGAASEPNTVESEPNEAASESNTVESEPNQAASESSAA